MRYTIRLMIILLALILIPCNWPSDKDVGKITFDNHAFSSGYNFTGDPKTVPGNYSATDKLKDIPMEIYDADIMSPSPMQNVILAAAVCVSNIPMVTADQLVTQ